MNSAAYASPPALARRSSAALQRDDVAASPDAAISSRGRHRCSSRDGAVSSSLSAYEQGQQRLAPCGPLPLGVMREQKCRRADGDKHKPLDSARLLSEVHDGELLIIG